MKLNDSFTTGAVLVTGGSGFVGTHLCQSLAAKGWRVICASRTARRPDASSAANISHVQLSGSSPIDEWRSALRSVRCIIHLSALVHQMGNKATSEAAYWRTNVQETQFIAQQGIASGVHHFVFMSSIKVNGEGGATSLYNSADDAHPLDSYARSKWQAEMILRDVCADSGMALTCIRPPLIYGPGVRANFRRLIALAASGLPLPFAAVRNQRSLLGVSNLVSFIEHCLAMSENAAGTWLISDGNDLSTPELIRRLASVMGQRARLLSVPPRLLLQSARLLGMGAEMSRLCGSLRIDLHEVRARLGWLPPMEVDVELQRTVAHYLRTSKRPVS